MIGPIGWEEFDDRQTDDRQTDRRQTDDRQTENSNPSVPYDTFACFAGLIIKIITISGIRKNFTSNVKNHETRG